MAFNEIQIPTFNALTAGQLDASSTISDNMPASHLLYSLSVFNAFQSENTATTPSSIQTNNGTSDTKESPDTSQPSSKSDNTPCGTFDFGCKFLQLLESSEVGKKFADIFIRANLGVFAMLLFILGIILITFSFQAPRKAAKAALL